MTEDSVYVKPIPVAFANPKSLADLKQVYESKREPIRQRLHELRAGWSKTDEGIFAELCYCILLAGRKAEATLPLVTQLEKDRLLFVGSKEQVEMYLGQHGYAVTERTNYIPHWRNRFDKDGSLRVRAVLENRFRRPDAWNIPSLRENLATERNGVGWKVSSQFLRNIGIGLGHGLALLDRHIQRELMKFGYISEIHDQALDKKTYLEYERRMQKLSDESEIPMDDLDLLLWSNRTGKIIK